MEKKKKRYTVKTGCPQCGCTQTTVMSEKELKERYGHVPNFDMEGGECRSKSSKPAKEASIPQAAGILWAFGWLTPLHLDHWLCLSCWFAGSRTTSSIAASLRRQPMG